MTNAISVKGFSELTYEELISIEGGFWFGVIGAAVAVYTGAYFFSNEAGKTFYYMTHR